MRVSWLFSAFALFFLIGCQEEKKSQAPPPTTPTTATKTEPVAPPPPPPPVVLPSNPNASATAAEPKKTSSIPEGMTAQKADVGVGVKGRGYGEGIISTPVATYFAARERIAFTIQIPEFIRAYEFEHDMKSPKSNEEFMEKIIKKNNIQLPELPAGHQYFYDPESKQLMVIQPK